MRRRAEPVQIAFTRPYPWVARPPDDEPRRAGGTVRDAVAALGVTLVAIFAYALVILLVADIAESCPPRPPVTVAMEAIQTP